MPDFDVDTAIVPLGDGAYDAEIHSHWFVARGPNGGYVAAIVLRAIAHAVDDPRRAPRSLTVHYVRAPEAGPVRIETTIERTGRTLTTVTARMIQRDRLVALAVAALASGRGGIELDETTMPVAPSPDEVPPIPPGEPRPVGSGPVFRVPVFLENYDIRWAVGAPPYAGADRALVGGWIRTATPRRPDALSVAAFSDAFPPPVFSRLREGLVLAPTVDLTIHFRAELPLAGAVADGWCLASFSSRMTRDGYFEEDGEVWSADGTLLAQSRQLALLIPVPAERASGARRPDVEETTSAA